MTFTWTAQNGGAPTTTYWKAIVSSADGTKLAAVVNISGNIWLSTNSGVTWTAQAGGAPTSAQWSSITSSSDGTKLAAAVSGGNIWTSNNSGGSWVERTSGLPSSGYRYWSSIASSADGTKLAATMSGNGVIWSSYDSGATWTDHYGLKQTIALGYSDGWATNLDQPHSPWIKVYDGSNSPYYIWFNVTDGAHYPQLDPGAYTGGGTGIFVDGLTTGMTGAQIAATIQSVINGSYSSIWTTALVGSEVRLTNTTPGAVDSPIGGEVEGAQAGAQNYYTVTSGTGPTPNPAPSAYWNSITSSSDGTKLAATNAFVASVNGDIWLSSDSGANWTVQNGGAPTSAYWSSITSSSNGSILAASNIASTWVSIDSGGSWTLSASAPANVNTITSSADGLKLAVGVSSGNIYLSADSGANWTAQTGVPSNGSWSSIASSADGTKLAAADATPGNIWLRANVTAPTTIDGSNNTVTGTTTWGDGSSLTLTTSGVVQAGATLTLNIPNLEALTGTGFHIEVQPGGSLTVGTQTVVSVDGQPYRINGR